MRRSINAAYAPLKNSVGVTLKAVYDKINRTDPDVSAALIRETAADKERANNETICTNRRARHEYEILEQLECGIVLKGSEVKSLRDGKVSLEEAWARLRDEELWLIGCDIAPYPQANVMNHEPRRDRKLLLHKREIRKFADRAEQKSLTLVPLAMYFTRGKVKVKIAVAKGKQLHDKREKLKTDEVRREIDRAMKRN